MINLLPKKEKDFLLNIEKIKVLQTIGLITIVAMVCMALILILIKANIKYYYNNELTTLEIKNITGKNQEDFTKLIKESNNIITLISDFYTDTSYFSDVMDIISQIQSPDNLHITNISLLRNKDNGIEVSAQGISDSREKLIIYKENIEKNNKIKNPLFSPDSWIRSENLKFSFSFLIEKNAEQ